MTFLFCVHGSAVLLMTGGLGEQTQICRPLISLNFTVHRSNLDYSRHTFFTLSSIHITCSIEQFSPYRLHLSSFCLHLLES